MNKKSKLFTYTGMVLLMSALLLTTYNLWSDRHAGHAAEQIAADLKRSVYQTLSDRKTEVEYIPSYILNPEMSMPTQLIDAREYIGILSIPALKLELPLLSEWDYPGLKISPCRYAGSAYLNNMVVAGHNYSRHFGKLKYLTQGDSITFTDFDGNIFRYQVSELEVLSPKLISEMVTGDWDLTLFTCTFGGKSRLAVRCVLVQ